MPVRVVLASQSPRRRDLLTLIGIPHDVRPADVDETVLPGEAPIPHCERLACAKAWALAATEPDALVIGSDTIVVIDGDILGKPRSEDEARAMLARLNGRTHIVHTAVAVVYQGRTRSGVESVSVTFRALNAAQMADYVSTGEPMDKAGAYGIQGFGATIVERIDGDYFAVMGLALGRLVRLMAELGVEYHFGPLRCNIGARAWVGGEPPALRVRPAE
ncbi:MAG: septum formation inhibitor Maf [Gemmatimonadaceae bacterium]|nr:septum formation inhibitor Maf [Gemmatimonadaceae bacterium]